MNFILFIYNKKNCSESIVWSINFLYIRDPVCENKYRNEYLLKRVESIMIRRIELPSNVLLDEVC